MFFEVETLLGISVYAWIWLAVVVFTLVIEFATTEIVSIWFFVGSLISMILAICKVDPAIQIVVFVIISVLALLIARPFVKKWTKRNEIKTNVDSIIGRIAIVTEDIIDGNRGVVKLDSQEWSAISNDDIVKGTKVVILSIEVNKLIVKENKATNNNVSYE